MKSAISKHAGHDFTVTTNGDAVAILEELGLVEQLQVSPLSGTKAHVNAIEFRAHPDYWVIGLHFAGYSRHQDNGFVVYGLHKDRTTPAKFEAFATAVRLRHGAVATADN